MGLETRRESKRISRILKKLNQVWRSLPDLRLGQLLSNLVPDFETHTFFIEDDELEKILDIYLKYNAKPNGDPYKQIWDMHKIFLRTKKGK